MRLSDDSNDEYGTALLSYLDSEASEHETDAINDLLGGAGELVSGKISQRLGATSRTIDGPMALHLKYALIGELQPQIDECISALRQRLSGNPNAQHDRAVDGLERAIDDGLDSLIWATWESDGWLED